MTSFPAAFGKYILLKPLAQGGMGELYLAASGEVGGFEKLCAIKKVLASSENDELVRRFQDEGKVVVKLSHGNLVQVFDVGFVGDEVYLAMEYVEGHDLRDVMIRCVETSTRIPLEVALYIVMQICRGLHYAHSYGNLHLVHRDICPSNILVSYFGEVKITDFGLAHSVLKQSLTEPGKIYGRFSYLTPEQARREETDHHTDIYATGIILWELLVGRPLRPGPHQDLAATLSLIRAAKVPAPSACNPRITKELDAIVVKALHPQPRQRHSTAEEMRSALAQVLARINPGFDAGGMASFMRHLYTTEIDQTRTERERLLAQDYSRLRTTSRPPLPPPTNGSEQMLEGQVVDGRYRIIRLIGEGGMGSVYEAEHTEIGRHVALKILHAVYSGHPETVARFRQEARATSQIGHPNIVEVMDSGCTLDGRFYFAMERLSGLDLAQLMVQNRIVPVRRALRITLQICRALQAAHGVGIVHRDLKPENIFLIEREGKRDFVKILDFGIAKNLELAKRGDLRLTHPGMAMGTPEYMAPEQAAGADIDPRIDIYATGAMLYEMLTGHLPHEGDNLMQVLSRKASEPVIPPKRYRPRMPDTLQEVILKAIAFNPDERFATMEEFARSLVPFTMPGAADWAAESEDDEGDTLDELANATVRMPGIEVMAAVKTFETDETVPVALATHPDGSSPGARVVRPGQVRLSSQVVSVGHAALQVTPTGTANPAPGARATEQFDKTRRQYVRRPLLLFVFLGFAVATVGGALWCSHYHGRRATARDAGRAVVTISKPDATVEVVTQVRERPKLTPQEVERMIEWAKRAADGGRYQRPKGDNVLELLARIEQDYPGHPAVQRLRKELVLRLVRDLKQAKAQRNLKRLESLLEAWIALEPQAPKPQRALASVYIMRGKQLFKRRQYAEASAYGMEASKLMPDNIAAHELLGDADERRSRYPQAVKHYLAALKAPKLKRAQTTALKKKLRKVQRLANH